MEEGINMDTIETTNTEQDPFEQDAQAPADQTPQTATPEGWGVAETSVEGTTASDETQQEDPAPSRPTRTVQIEEAPLPNLDDTSVCLILTLNKLGNRKQVSSTAPGVQVDADPDMITVSKKLLKSATLDAIIKKDGEIYNYFKKKAMPSMFKSGIYRIGDKHIERDVEWLQQQKAERETLVEAFLAEYGADVQASLDLLRAVGETADYSSVEEVRAEFDMSWRIVAFGTPQRLQRISDSVWADEREKARAGVQSEAEECRQALRLATKKIVDHMVDRLQVDPTTGKPRVFRDSMVRNFREFLADFDGRNITDDAGLAGLMEKAKNLLDGVHPDDLRQVEGTRTNVLSGINEIKQCLDAMVTTAPDRMITFDDVA